ncbi:hypothetical protein [Planctomicrobium sp. SH664]|uniref:hypothetical protein n=1 Tax=Planctomicrobium sp. SH664 TaxID=3448125 RepID=UPI003F5BEE4F
MDECTLESTAVEWIREHPQTMRLLESLGIDCTCDGKSLGYLCQQQQLVPAEVLSQLNAIVARKAAAGGA